MSSRKDYVRAANIVKALYAAVYAAGPMSIDEGNDQVFNVTKPVAVEKAFVRFFVEEPSAMFDADKFRKACKPTDEEVAVIVNHERQHKQFLELPKPTALSSVLRDDQKPKKRTRKSK
jgi:hypothetical protein